MTAGGRHNVKNFDLVERYQSYLDRNKTSYNKFVDRVKRGNEPLETAIKKVGRIKKPNSLRSKVDDLGRVCTACNQYKIRYKYHKSAVGVKGYTNNCRECRNKLKQEYRIKTNYAKDRQLKEKRRSLNIGEVIALCDPVIYEGNPREEKLKVISYKFKKGYQCVSLLTGEERRISTSDNHNTKFNHSCVRFYRLEDSNITQIPVTKKIEKQSEFIGLP